VRTIPGLLIVVTIAGAAYLVAWPVPIDAVAWEPPADAGYTGAHATNHRLVGLERVPVPGLTGPEDVVLAPDGTLYTTSHEGVIAYRPPGADTFTEWTRIGGRPLGLDWDEVGDRLVIADAFDGLWAVTTDRRARRLTNEVDGSPIRYADDVVAARDGTLYFTDASTKFGAQQWGGTYEASLVDILEHGRNGRVLAFHPSDGRTTTVIDQIQFANGIALSNNESRLFVVETGEYRILAYHLSGPRKGETEVLIDNLPGYPDNISKGSEGRLWVGLVSGRRAIVDRLAPQPLLREVIYRLPRSVRPEANRYGHVIAVDETGRVVADLQDPTGDFAHTTTAIEMGRDLWIASLHEPDLGRVRDWQTAL